MKVFVCGGSGFVGTRLTAYLLEQGHEVVALGTSKTSRIAEESNYRYISADASEVGDWQAELADVDAVVNLAGKNIFNRWTDSYKKSIYDSRVLTTRNIVDGLPDSKPVLLCSTSAVGFYGNRGDEKLDENSTAGEGFLATVGQDWEKEALQAEQKGHRVALMRFGIVLGKGGGAMAKMLPAFKMMVGGPLGDGRQWFPWIHMDDVIGAIDFIFKNKQMQGPINFTAPNPVQNREMAKTLGRVLLRPAFMPTPAFMIRLAMGELGDTLLDSQRAVPGRLLQNGYSFQYPDLEPALRQIVAS